MRQAPPDYSAASRKSRAEGRAIVLLILAGFLGCFFLWYMSGGARGGSSGPSISGAQVACQRFVRNRLKAPSTAKFPANPSVSHVGNGCYYMSSHVEAQNAFGVPIRNGFTCEVCYHDDAYTLESLDLYD